MLLLVHGMRSMGASAMLAADFAGELDTTSHAIRLPRLAPAFLTRSGRRVTRTGILAFDLLSHLRSELAGTHFAAAVARRADVLAWVAENLAAVHGVEVEPPAALASGPRLVIAQSHGLIAALAILSQLPAVAVTSDDSLTWPVIGAALRELGVVVHTREVSRAALLRHVRRTWERGVAVVSFGAIPHEALLAAAALAVPVTAVRVHTSNSDGGRHDFLREYLRTVARPKTRVRVELYDAA